jgi:ABC-type nickel/cobalt efflux system permease component RcnA
MKTDSFAASLIWGRIGAAILALMAFGLTMLGVDFSAADQATVFEIVSGILAGIAGVLAIISKLREQRRQKNEVD